MERYIQYLIVTTGEGLWEDADTGLEQTGGGGEKEPTEKGQTENMKGGLESIHKNNLVLSMH